MTWRCSCGYVNAITSQTRLVVAHCGGCNHLHPSVEHLIDNEAMLMALAINVAIANQEQVSYDS